MMSLDLSNPASLAEFLGRMDEKLTRSLQIQEEHAASDLVFHKETNDRVCALEKARWTATGMVAGVSAVISAIVAVGTYLFRGQ